MKVVVYSVHWRVFASHCHVPGVLGCSLLHDCDLEQLTQLLSVVRLLCRRIINTMVTATHKLAYRYNTSLRCHRKLHVRCDLLLLLWGVGEQEQNKTKQNEQKLGKTNVAGQVFGYAGWVLCEGKGKGGNRDCTVVMWRVEEAGWRIHKNS